MIVYRDVDRSDSGMFKRLTAARTLGFADRRASVRPASPPSPWSWSFPRSSTCWPGPYHRRTVIGPGPKVVSLFVTLPRPMADDQPADPGLGSGQAL